MVLLLTLAVACESRGGRLAEDRDDEQRNRRPDLVAPATLEPLVDEEEGEEEKEVLELARLDELRAHPRVVAQAHDLARDRWTVEVSLRRASRYFPMIERYLSQSGLPGELAYVPMVESRFLPDARNRRALGMWQFTAPTARAYGLRVDQGVDERRDPEKSTRAAILYLQDLHDRFGSWELALAAYNAGPSRVRRALIELPGASFWELAEAQLLPPITRSYVPKVIGSAMIAEHPERFGILLPAGLAAGPSSGLPG